MDAGQRVSRGGEGMDEHDDDLESTVHEGAQKERDSFPDTGDELDDKVPDTPEGAGEEPSLDDDAAEL
jgi:hypothetical protein